MIEPQLTKKWILERISQEEIFTRYLGLIPKEYEGFKNPLREDKEGDCFFYYNPQGELRFKDFAYGFNWSCIDVVMVSYNLNFGNALLKICEDYKLLGISGNIYKPQSIQSKSPSTKPIVDLQIKTREFEQIDWDYWGQYHLEEKDLINVFPTKVVWINGKKIYIHNNKDICYTYKFNYLKAYFPLRVKRYRFIQQKNEIQGLNILQPSELLIVTKSYKDVLLLRKLGYSSISPASESDIIKKEDIDRFKLSFKRIVVFLDNDKAGMTASEEYKKLYNLETIFIPNTDIKDITDYAKVKGLEESKNLIKELIK